MFVFVFHLYFYSNIYLLKWFLKDMLSYRLCNDFHWVFEPVFRYSNHHTPSVFVFVRAILSWCPETWHFSSLFTTFFPLTSLQFILLYINFIGEKKRKWNTLPLFTKATYRMIGTWKKENIILNRRDVNSRLKLCQDYGVPFDTITQTWLLCDHLAKLQNVSGGR